MNNICLYHGSGCQDGFMSAYIMYLYFKELDEECEFIAVNYNEPIPDVADKNVYIVDFSYTPGVLKEASKTAKKIIMLDHHLTAAQQWGGYGKFDIPETVNADGVSYIIKNKITCRVDVLIDENKSGAGLALDYVLNYRQPGDSNYLFNNRLVRIVEAVQDRDLWLFKNKDTKTIHELLQSIPKTFEALDHLIFEISNTDFDFRMFAAERYFEIKEKLAQDYAEKYQLISFQGYEIPIVNVPANFSSRVGEILCEIHPFALMYCLSTTIVYCSLRSSKRTGIDIATIAEKFSGGGHKLASGFKITPEELPRLLKGLF